MMCTNRPSRTVAWVVLLLLSCCDALLELQRINGVTFSSTFVCADYYADLDTRVADRQTNGARVLQHNRYSFAIQAVASDGKPVTHGRDLFTLQITHLGEHSFSTLLSRHRSAGIYDFAHWDRVPPGELEVHIVLRSTPTLDTNFTIDSFANVEQMEGGRPWACYVKVGPKFYLKKPGPDDHVNSGDIVLASTRAKPAFDPDYPGNETYCGIERIRELKQLNRTLTGWGLVWPPRQNTTNSTAPPVPAPSQPLHLNANLHPCTGLLHHNGSMLPQHHNASHYPCLVHHHNGSFSVANNRTHEEAHRMLKDKSSPSKSSKSGSGAVKDVGKQAPICKMPTPGRWIEVPRALSDSDCPQHLCEGNLSPLQFSNQINMCRAFHHVYVPYTCRYRLYSPEQVFQCLVVNSLLHELCTLNRTEGPQVLRDHPTLKLANIIEPHGKLMYKPKVIQQMGTSLNRFKKLLKEVTEPSLKKYWMFQARRMSPTNEGCQHPQNAIVNMMCAQEYLYKRVQGMDFLPFDMTAHSQDSKYEWYDDYVHYGNFLSNGQALMAGQIFLNMICGEPRDAVAGTDLG